ncbi:MAG: hypothetical protein AAFR37_18205, partial [Cyanobacteria bacterium J06628_3]
MYKYVGSDEIRENTVHLPAGKKILSIDDINNWIRETKQQPDSYGLIAATFVPNILPDTSAIYLFPIILGFSFGGCILGTFVSPPDNREVL